MSKTKIALIIVVVLAMFAIVYYATKRNNFMPDNGKLKIIKRCKSYDTGGRCTAHEYTLNGRLLTRSEYEQQISSGAEIVEVEDIGAPKGKSCNDQCKDMGYQFGGFRLGGSCYCYKGKPETTK